MHSIQLPFVTLAAVVTTATVVAITSPGGMTAAVALAAAAIAIAAAAIAAAAVAGATASAVAAAACEQGVCRACGQLCQVDASLLDKLLHLSSGEHRVDFWDGASCTKRYSRLPKKDPSRDSQVMKA